MKIQRLMELILFVVEAVNISQVKEDGKYESYVIGDDGAWILIM